jgi:uncharacterized membrane protein
VQAIDYDGIAHALKEREALAEVLVRPGHHVLKDRLHGHVWPAEALDDTLTQAFREAVVIGAERTPVQDVEFSIRQLVEVALRALSPGINDPFTAIAVIDRLATSLALAMECGEPRTVWCDEEGRARLRAVGSTFDGIVDLSFNQIRQAAASHPDILIKLLDTLSALGASGCDGGQAQTLRRHIDAVMETARQSVVHPADLAAINARHAAAIGRA